MTVPSCALRPAFVQAALEPHAPNERAFIRECSRAQRCPVSKPDRERFFSRLGPEMRALLPYAGLFKAEWDRREAERRIQARLTPELRERQAATLRAYLSARNSARDPRATKPTGLGPTPDTSPASETVKTASTGGEPA